MDEVKEQKRKEGLVAHGYLTVDKLVEKLNALQAQGHGNDLVGSDYEHYQYCEYEEAFGYVVVC